MKITYEKLDGSCLILYGLYDDQGNLLEVVPKTRGVPVADKHIVEMYNEIEIKLKTVGCDMVFLPHTDGISSTQLTQTLHDIMENDG